MRINNKKMTQAISYCRAVLTSAKYEQLKHNCSATLKNLDTKLKECKNDNEKTVINADIIRHNAKYQKYQELFNDAKNVMNENETAYNEFVNEVTASNDPDAKNSDYNIEHYLYLCACISNDNKIDNSLLSYAIKDNYNLTKLVNTLDTILSITSSDDFTVVKKSYRCAVLLNSFMKLVNEYIQATYTIPFQNSLLQHKVKFRNSDYSALYHSYVKDIAVDKNGDVQLKKAATVYKNGNINSNNLKKLIAKLVISQIIKKFSD